MQEALDAQKEEFQRRETTFKRREEVLKNKDRELQARQPARPSSLQPIIDPPPPPSLPILASSANACLRHMIAHIGQPETADR